MQVDGICKDVLLSACGRSLSLILGVISVHDHMVFLILGWNLDLYQVLCQSIGCVLSVFLGLPGIPAPVLCFVRILALVEFLYHFFVCLGLCLMMVIHQFL